MKLSTNLIVAITVTILLIVNSLEMMDTLELRQAVTVEGIRSHLAALQAIADQHDGNRASGTIGYDESVAHVVSKLQEAGYEVVTQEFEFTSETDSVPFQATSKNVLAETLNGRDDWVVVVGAHLDSVVEGPGINDNGSGSATILEIAIQMAQLEIVPRNKVRFAWWGAEEVGLLGSTYYVEHLSELELENIALNLNFDMLASPNYVRFVTDGDGSDHFGLGGPPGSEVIEEVFLDYFADQGLTTAPWVLVTDFGLSDHASFMNASIPAGGLFSGANGIKTEDEAAIFGGTAGVAYDACYHLACDSFNNTNLVALDELGDAAAHAVLTFAMYEQESSMSPTTAPTTAPFGSSDSPTTPLPSDDSAAHKSATRNTMPMTLALVAYYCQRL